MLPMFGLFFRLIIAWFATNTKSVYQLSPIYSYATLPYKINILYLRLSGYFLLHMYNISILVVKSVAFFLFLALPELTRKQVADMFYNAELEYEMREPTKPHQMKWSFKTDAQRDEYIKEITDEAASSVYHHQQADKCTVKGT